MHAYILCGGLGTRLRSVIHDTQKAMVDVHGRPFLARVLRQLKAAGLQHATLCAHYRADQLEAQRESMGREAGLLLDMVVEAEPLGTGGALLNALRERPPSGRYLVLNADTYLEPDAYHQAMAVSGNALVGVAVDDRSRYGSLALDTNGDLLQLLEKGVTGAGLINAGVYAFDEHAFAEYRLQPCSMEQELVPYLISKARVTVVPYHGRFIDIGTPDSLSTFVADYQTDTLS